MNVCVISAARRQYLFHFHKLYWVTNLFFQNRQNLIFPLSYTFTQVGHLDKLLSTNYICLLHDGGENDNFKMYGNLYCNLYWSNQTVPDTQRRIEKFHTIFIEWKNIFSLQTTTKNTIMTKLKAKNKLSVTYDVMP